ncbi:MAG: hypothetical protein HY812_17075 [Planctomycetes bacterium]|nr:hypothetical protein [Planctomycetota bacterium]
MEQPFGNLVAAIIRRLASSDVVIAVLSARNPNVFYELGVRHSLRLNTVMLVEQWDEYPFDLQSYFSHKFSVAHEADRDDLKAFVKARLVQCDKAALPDSPVLDILRTSEVEQLRVINAWETRRAAIMIEGLVSEVTGVLRVFQKCLKTAHEIHAAKRRNTPRKRVVLSWDVIDGFTKNRPIPGFPATAYRDSEAIYHSWREMQRLWNAVMDDKKPVKAELLEFIVATTHRRTLAYLFDLLGAWRTVMQERVSFGLPWHSSMEQAEDAIRDTATLMAVDKRMLTELAATNEMFNSFEGQFLGVSQVLLEMIQKEETPSFSKFAVSNAGGTSTAAEFVALTREPKKKMGPKRKTLPPKVSKTPRRRPTRP